VVVSYPARETNYVVITPVRDEAAHIEATLQSMVQQTVRPVEWVIVDDGSTDGTVAIVKRYAAEHSWMSAVCRSNQGPRQNATGVMEAFCQGYNALRTKDWEFIVKLDGDVSFEPTYFERCFEEFQSDSQLGVGGGLLWNVTNGQAKPELCPLNHVRGATKVYRRQCWEAIGGLLRVPGWDTIDEVKAQMSGWKVRTFRDLKLLHHRPTGAAEGAWRDAVKNGRADYICGYHPLFMVVKCLKRIFQRPYLLDGAGHLYGFTTGYLKGIPQVQDNALIRYVRRHQMRRLLFQDSIWK